MKYIKIAFDVAMLAGVILFVYKSNESNGTFAVTSISDYIAFFAVICFIGLSVICYISAFFFLWPTSKEAKQLRILYLIPFLSAFIAYARLRTGKGFMPSA